MKIKICGLTSPKEAQYLNTHHVDFAGFVLFFPKSKRNITISQAKKIMEQLHPDIQTVAVVVSPTTEQITQIAQAGFSYVQIHGTLSPEVEENCPLPILKAFNVSDLDEFQTWLQNPTIAGFVFDAQEPGSGKTFDWNLVPHLPKTDKIFLLAGGLHPNNVAKAITAIQPDGVDVSSGVENENGTGKSPDKIQAFVSAVRTVSHAK